MTETVQKYLHKNPPIRNSSVEFAVVNNQTSEKEFELNGVKIKAQCKAQQIPNDPNYKIVITIICNEKLVNNLWQCTGDFKVCGDFVEHKSKTVKFIFGCGNKTLIIDDLLCSEIKPITLKTKLVDVVGYQPIPYFDFEVPGFSDVTFLIEDRHVYAHKSILAINSTYFSSMFLSSFSEKSKRKIRLDFTIFDEFVEFLNAIYPTNHIVTENNIECQLRFADMYHAVRVLSKCEKFLETTNKIKLSEKLDYAERYGLANLEKICIESLKSVNDIKNLLNEFPAKNKEEKLECFSEAMQIKILERFTKFHIAEYCADHEESSKINNEEIEKSFEQRFEEWKDIIIKTEGIELLVNRAYLSIFSSYFREIFHEDIEKDSFILENVKCDEFIEFLSYIHDPYKIITETTIDNVTFLSDYFGVPYLVDRCKKYWNDIIQQNDNKPLNTKMTGALFGASEKFGFSEIQERVLTRMRTKNETRLVILSPEFNKLGPKSRLATHRCYFTANSNGF